MNANHGWVAAPGFERVAERFSQQLAEDPGYSAQVTAYVGGDVVIDLWGGDHLAADSVTGFFSVSKGIAALAIALLVDRQVLDPDAVVSRYWPEFAQNGKVGTTVRQVLSHQAGLPAIDGGIETEHVLDSRLGAELLARQAPFWEPGALFGYHALTIGILMEELVRRAAGCSLQELYDAEIRRPRDIDAYLGTSAAVEARYRAVLPQPIPDPLPALPADGLLDAALGRAGRPVSLVDSSFSPNHPDIRRAGVAAVGGVGSARGLARLYAASLGHVGEPFVTRSTVDRISRTQVAGHDTVVMDEMAFALGFMKPTGRMPFSGPRAFGHDGAGGALAFADPQLELAFGYIPAPMSSPGGADVRALELSRLIRSSIAATTRNHA